MGVDGGEDEDEDGNVHETVGRWAGIEFEHRRGHARWMGTVLSA